MCYYEFNNVHVGSESIALPCLIINMTNKIMFRAVLDREESMPFVIMVIMYTVKYGGGWETSVHVHCLSHIVYLKKNVLTCDFDI